MTHEIFGRGAPLQWACRLPCGVEEWPAVVGASRNACLPHAVKSRSRSSIWSSILKKVELAGRLFVRAGGCWDLSRTNSLTSARHEDGLEYIRI